MQMNIQQIDGAYNELCALLKGRQLSSVLPENLRGMSRREATNLADRIDELHREMGDYSCSDAERVRYGDGWQVTFRWSPAGTGTDEYPEGIVYGAEGEYYHL